MSFLFGLLALIFVCLLLIYLFLIFPRIGGADMELLRVHYAHRGIFDRSAPENSLSAFAAAIRCGVGIELDVQRSRDGRLMVFHDADLKRMCGLERRVCELTCAELKALRLAGTQETIPTLDEVLALVRGRVSLLIEIKGERPDPPLYRRLIRLLDGYNGPFCLESFSPLILRWFKHYRPSFARGQLVGRITKKELPKSNPFVRFFLSHMMFNFLSRPDFIAIDGRLRKRPSFLLCTRLFHTTGFAWTVRTRKDLMLCRRGGLFTIYENHAALFPKRTGGNTNYKRG